jgi:hypothetical protein
MMRTVDEARARVHAIAREDVLGFETTVLAGFVPGLLKDPWKVDPLTEDEVVRQMRDYMPFACDKALGHRGISAGRSVAHYRAWLWLLGDDELVGEIDGGLYQNYGVPVLKRVARKYAFPVPPAIEAWEDGKACRDDCRDGCDR